MCGCVLPTPNATPYDPQPQLAQHQLGGRADLKYWTTRRDQWEVPVLNGETGGGGLCGNRTNQPKLNLSVPATPHALQATGIGGVQGRQLTGPGNHSQLAGKAVYCSHIII